ncbi:hypothetical protein DL98DRAFT_440790, partial [Cadophora sp. DSE1049]
AHTLVYRNKVVRIQINIQIKTRTDKKKHFAEKLIKVESIFTKKNHNVSRGDKVEKDITKL